MKLKLTTLLALSMLVLASCKDRLPTQPPNPPSQPPTASADTILHWTFDGNTHDVSGNGYDGDSALFGVANINYNYPDRFHNFQSGSYNQAISMVGKCRVEANNMLVFTDSDSYTVSFWANFSANSNFSVSANSFEFFTAGGSLAGCGPLPANMLPAGTSDSWHLLTLTVKAHSAATIYFDSVILATKPYGTYTPTSSGHDHFALIANDNYQADTARFDDMLLLHHAMTASEVATRFHEGGWMTTTHFPDSGNTKPGADWTKVNLGTSEDLTDMTFAEYSDTGFNRHITAMYASGFNGTILKSVDQGNTWSRLNSGTTENLYRISFQSLANMNEGFAAGNNGTLLYTTNGGAAWTNIGPIPGGDIRDLYWDGWQLIVVGGNGSTGFIAASQDKGLTWTTKTTSGTIYCINVQNNTCVAAGLRGQIYVASRDHLETWNDRSVNSNADFIAITGWAESFWLTTFTGSMYKSESSGNSWTGPFASGATTPLRGAVVVAADLWYDQSLGRLSRYTVWMGGENGALLRYDQNGWARHDLSGFSGTWNRFVLNWEGNWNGSDQIREVLLGDNGTVYWKYN